MDSGEGGSITRLAVAWLMKQIERLAEAASGFLLLLIMSDHVKKKKKWLYILIQPGHLWHWAEEMRLHWDRGLPQKSVKNWNDKVVLIACWMNEGNELKFTFI